MTVWNTLTTDQQQALHVLQQELEVDAVDEGVTAYRRRRVQQEPSENTPEKSLILSSIESLSAAIQQAVDDYINNEKALKGVRQWGPCLLGLEAEKIAIITLRQIINARPGKYNSIDHSYTIARGVKMERELMLLKEQHRDVYDYVRRRNKNWNARAHQAAKRAADVVDVEWDKRRRLHVGQFLLHLAIEHTLLFDVTRWYSGRKKQIKVTLTDEAMQWLEKEHERAEILSPRFLPMVTPPVPWTTQRDGGYVLLREPLIKPSLGVGSPGERDRLSLPDVYDAVNSVQQTEWRVNRKLLDVQSTLWDAGGVGLVPSEPLPLPPRPKDIDSNPTAKKNWKAEAAKVYDENATLASQRLAVVSQLRIAKQFRRYEVIHFPHQLDWRGRIYPMASYLNPQSQDSGRALLEFARGRPLGRTGLRWLYIHAANLFGEDKVSNNDREKWTRDNLQDIIHSAYNPVEHRWWLRADKPWQFLAACFEVRDTAQLSRSEVSNYRSHLPVAMDGSCNGLQHLSALGADDVGGRATNLTDARTPNDIYTQVAEEVNRLIQEDIKWTDPNPTTTHSVHSTDTSDTGQILKSIAIGWKGRIDRKVVKRAVMTIPYGLTRQGMMKQLLEDKWTTSQKEAAYLRDKIEQALDGTIVKAREIMVWLQEIASITAKDGHALRWWSPAGFPVIQEYLEQRQKTIFTALQKLTYRVTLEDAGVSLNRQVRGLPPNLVHSFDAAHLMRVVKSAVTHGITSFQLIHDSYGVHAADVELFHQIIRQEFVTMYETRWLEKLHRDWEQQTGLQLPSPPSQGNLNLREVMASQYFFS